MKILALETSGSNCSVALIDEEKTISEFSLSNGTTHSQNLVPMLDQIQKFSNIDLKDIDCLACSVGPGSFTGLRIGIATIKGIAVSLNKPVIGVSSLTGLAYNVPYFDGTICSIIDAKNNNVYAGIYTYTDKPTLACDYISDSIDVLIDKLKSENNNILFIGDGAYAYMDKLKETFSDKAHFVPIHLNNQIASSIAKCALDEAKNNNYQTCDTLMPMYLKKSQAERMLDENAENTNS